jgi:glycosyltransferase involved in cell wall biosynthesis
MSYRIGFIIEQALGHITHGKNLQASAPNDPALEPVWAPIPWEGRGWAAKLPVVRNNWTARAGLTARGAVSDMVRSGRLDGLFFHTQVTAVLASNWVRRFPSVVSLDATPIQYDSLGLYYAHGKGPGWLEGLKWRLNRDCFRAARAVVAWSEWAKEGLVRDYEVPSRKIHVIPPGVNSGEWERPSPRTLSDGPVRILFVGGNLERKGGLLLLDAFRSLRDRGVELHLVTRDAVPEEPGLRVYRDMQPNSEPLKHLYHSCDLFCLPTYGDCLPMVLSEAGAAGLPCVTTDVGAIPELVRDRETGIVVPVGDAAALTRAIDTLVESPDLRLRMGRRAVEVIRSEFDAGKTSLRLFQLLKQTVDEARGRRR